VIERLYTVTEWRRAGFAEPGSAARSAVDALGDDGYGRGVRAAIDRLAAQLAAEVADEVTEPDNAGGPGHR
jgi:hypothetical protein